VPADIQKIAVADGRVVISLLDQVSRAESVVSLTPGSAEIWAHDILDAVRQLDRKTLVTLIASLRRQAQQVQTSLDKAVDQLAALDKAAPAAVLLPDTDIDFEAIAAAAVDEPFLTPGRKIERAGPPSSRATPFSVVFMPEVVG
jgi:hypothetical protein